MKSVLSASCMIDYGTGVQDRAIFLISSLSISTGNPARIKYRANA